MVRREKRFNTSDPMDMMRVDAGHTWEEIVAHALQRREEKGGPKAGYRPEAICFDGIWCSPDWLNPGGQFPLEEWKATKTSSKKGWEAAHWYWELQVLGYAHALTELGILEVNSALVRVWYINGDYDWSAKVDDLTILRDYVEFELHFTARDKQDNWNKLKALGHVHGLLKSQPKFEQGEECQSQPETGEERTLPKRSSRPPQPSLAKGARVVTFPVSRNRLKKSDG